MTPLPEPSPFQRSRRMVLLHSHADIKSVNEIRSIVFTREPPDKLKSIRVTFHDGRESEVYEEKELAVTIQILQYWHPGEKSSALISDQALPDDLKQPIWEEEHVCPSVPPGRLPERASPSTRRSITGIRVSGKY